MTDINEFDPAFAPTTPYAASVSEDSPAGYTVKDVDASDADVTNNVLAYSITSGNAAGKFTIDSATGVIQVRWQIRGTNAGMDTMDVELKTQDFAANIIYL